MWSSNELLNHCAALRQHGIEPNFEPGERVARGFADLGFEEFIVLHGGKLSSLFTGKVSDLPLDDAKHFFRVLSVDETINEIERRSFSIVSLEYVDRRTWVLGIERVESRERHEFSSGRIENVFLEALRFVVSFNS